LEVSLKFFGTFPVNQTAVMVTLYEGINMLVSVYTECNSLSFLEQYVLYQIHQE